jgi:hypothetical protein
MVLRMVSSFPMAAMSATILGLPLCEATMQRKVETLMEQFPSQHSQNWFSAETFRALPRIRGLECNAPTGWAEVFHGRKLCLSAQ